MPLPDWRDYITPRHGAQVLEAHGYRLLYDHPADGWDGYRHMGYRRYICDGIATDAWVVQVKSEPLVSTQVHEKVVERLWGLLKGWRV